MHIINSPEEQMGLGMRKQTIWISDTNRPVQPRIKARSLNSKFTDVRRRGVVLSMERKTKALISCAFTAHLICAFVFAYAYCWFSYAATQMSYTM